MMPSSARSKGNYEAVTKQKWKKEGAYVFIALGGDSPKLLHVAVWQLLNQLGSEILIQFPFVIGRRKAGFDCLDIWHSPIPVWQLPEILLTENLLHKRLVDTDVETLPKQLLYIGDPPPPRGGSMHAPIAHFFVITLTEPLQTHILWFYSLQSRSSTSQLPAGGGKRRKNPRHSRKGLHDKERREEEEEEEDMFALGSWVVMH
jgi:hypothetical protein